MPIWEGDDEVERLVTSRRVERFYDTAAALTPSRSSPLEPQIALRQRVRQLVVGPYEREAHERGRALAEMVLADEAHFMGWVRSFESGAHAFTHPRPITVSARKTAGWSRPYSHREGFHLWLDQHEQRRFNALFRNETLRHIPLALSAFAPFIRMPIEILAKYLRRLDGDGAPSAEAIQEALRRTRSGLISNLRSHQVAREIGTFSLARREALVTEDCCFADVELYKGQQVTTLELVKGTAG